MTLPASGLLKLSQIRSEYSPTTTSYTLSAYAKYLGKSVGAALAMSEFYSKSSPHGVVAIDSTTPGSGNLSVPYGVTQAKVYAHGGGGGGGGASVAAGTSFLGGGGGSGGRNGWPDIIAVTPGGSLSYGIGAGGAGGISSMDYPGTNGSSGGGTFVGTVSVSGGGGGAGNSLGLYYAAGGAAGTPNGVAGSTGFPISPGYGLYVGGGDTGLGAGAGGYGGHLGGPAMPIDGHFGYPGRLRVEWV